MNFILGSNGDGYPNTLSRKIIGSNRMIVRLGVFFSFEEHI